MAGLLFLGVACDDGKYAFGNLYGAVAVFGGLLQCLFRKGGIVFVLKGKGGIIGQGGQQIVNFVGDHSGIGADIRQCLELADLKFERVVLLLMVLELFVQ